MSFEQFLSILRARKWLGVTAFLVVIITAAVISILMPKWYTSEAAIAIDVKAVDPITGQPITGYLAPSYIATQVDIMGSESVALKVVDTLGFVQQPQVISQFNQATKGKGDIRTWFAETLLKNLDIVPSRESNVINIKYTATDPKFAAVLANSFVDAYIKTTVDIKVSAAQQNNAFFQQQIKSLEDNLQKAQKKLSDYQQEEGIVATDERLDVETQRLNELASQLVGAQGQTFDAQSRTRGGDMAPDVLNNPLVQQLKAQVASQESKLKELAAKDGPNHPHYLQSLAELETTRVQLRDMMKQYAVGLSGTAGNSAARQNALQQSLARQKAKVLELKSQRSKLEVMQHEVDNSQRAYDLALQRLSQTSLESRSDSANITIIQSGSEPIDPSKPKVLINMLVAVFLGFVLAIGFCLLAELMDRRVRSTKDIQEILSIPVLAEINSVVSIRRRWTFFKKRQKFA